MFKHVWPVRKVTWEALKHVHRWCTGLVDELRQVAMAMHTRDQAPKEGKQASQEKWSEVSFPVEAVSFMAREACGLSRRSLRLLDDLDAVYTLDCN